MALLLFTAPWCPVCQDFEIHYSILRNKYTPFSDVLISRVNGDENPSLMTDFGIDEYPSFILFNRDCYYSQGGCLDQLQYWRYNGTANDAEDLSKFIDESMLERRIELNVPLIAQPDQGPCKGVAADLQDTTKPCPLSQTVPDGQPEPVGPNLFGPSTKGTKEPKSPTLWETRLTEEKLDSNLKLGLITTEEHAQKKQEILGEAVGFKEAEETPEGAATPAAEGTSQGASKVEQMVQKEGAIMDESMMNAAGMNVGATAMVQASASHAAARPTCRVADRPQGIVLPDVSGQ